MNPVFAKPIPMAKSRTRIAVVDDDASVRRALSRFLRASAYDTETYGSGSEFLESFNLFRPQCIVLDLHMAGMNGLDVQRHLSRIGSRAPVIVITGHDNHRAHAESRALGADAILAKPVDGPLLISTIEQLIGAVPDPC